MIYIINYVARDQLETWIIPVLHILLRRGSFFYPKTRRHLEVSVLTRKVMHEIADLSLSQVLRHKQGYWIVLGHHRQSAEGQLQRYTRSSESNMKAMFIYSYKVKCS
jgi:hypothetical protein